MWLLQRQRLYGKVLSGFKKACNKNNYEKKRWYHYIKKEKKIKKISLIKSKKSITYAKKKKFGTNDNNKKYQKVRDHCHCTGKFRGDAHDICNLRYKTPKKIPVVFHNGSTYD